MNSLMGCFADCPFDVLDGFFTSNPTNPEKRWPGTKWRQIKERFILAAGDTHPAGSTGGEFEHELTVDEMPKHIHRIAKGNQVTAAGAPQFGEYQAHQNESIITPGKYWTADTLNAGGNRPHNTTPPYFAMYFWQRTA